jgi:hypothetical protein
MSTQLVGTATVIMAICFLAATGPAGGTEPALVAPQQLRNRLETMKARSVVKVYCLWNGQIYRGSGFAILYPQTNKKCIVTSRHVCPGATSDATFQVVIRDEEASPVDCTPLAAHEECDLLILEADKELDCDDIELPAANLVLPKSGDIVFAIGSSSGRQPITIQNSDVLDCLKASRYSQNDRNQNFLGPNTDLIHHSRGTCPGFSGGPLINKGGELVGIHHGGLADAAFDHYAVAANYLNDIPKWPRVKAVKKPIAFSFTAVRPFAASFPEENLPKDTTRYVARFPIPMEENEVFLSQLTAHLHNKFTAQSPIVKQVKEVSQTSFSFVRFDHLGCSFLAPDDHTLHIGNDNSEDAEAVTFVLPHITISVLNASKYQKNADEEYLELPRADKHDRVIASQDRVNRTRDYRDFITNSILGACKKDGIETLVRDAQAAGLTGLKLRGQTKEPRITEGASWLEAVYSGEGGDVGYGLKIGVCDETALLVKWRFNLADYDKYVNGNRVSETFLKEMAVYCSSVLY